MSGFTDTERDLINSALNSLYREVANQYREETYREDGTPALGNAVRAYVDDYYKPKLESITDLREKLLNELPRAPKPGPGRLNTVT